MAIISALVTTPLRLGDSMVQLPAHGQPLAQATCTNSQLWRRVHQQIPTRSYTRGRDGQGYTTLAGKFTFLGVLALGGRAAELQHRRWARHSKTVLIATATAVPRVPDATGSMANCMDHVVSEAMRFTQRVDDGLQPKLWREADLVLVGPSRSGKTTLANYLARLGLKVANYPLVPGEEPPPELLKIDERRVVKLTIHASELQAIREDRAKRLGLPKSAYAASAEIQKELDWVKCFYFRNFPRQPIIDTARTGVAGTAALILSQLNRAGIDLSSVSGAGNSVSTLMS